MAERRTYQGATYERAGPGEPWRRVGGGQQPVNIGTPDPRLPAQTRQSNAEAVTAEAEAAEAARRQRAERERAEAAAATEAATARRAQLEQQNAPDPRNQRIAAQLQADSVLDSINTARRQIGDGWATGNVAGSGFFQGVPVAGQNSANLAATLSGIQGSIINDTLKALRAQSSTGSSGYGSLTESEAARLAASIGALQQTQDSEALLANLARVERHYRNALALLNNEDPREPDVRERYGIVGVPHRGDPQGGELTSEGRRIPDPALAGLNQTVVNMIRRGRNEAEIRAYLNRVRPGMGDNAVSVQENIDWVRQHPEEQPHVDLESIWEPASGTSQTIGEIGMTPFGSAAVGAADMVTMGTLDNLTDNPEMTRAVMTGLAERNPNSYLTGQIVGGVTGGLGVEGALARGGLTGLARARAGDALIGGLYGAGSADDGSRLGGAATGAGFGFLGGTAGRGAARFAGRLLAGIDDPARQALYDADVPMTIGQMLGGTAQRTEDRIAGLPFLGDQIRNRRMEGFEGFNRAAFDEALAPIGQTTRGVIEEPGVDLARQLRSDAYSGALDPVRVQADAPFVGDMQAAITAGQGLPSPMREAMEYTLPTRVGQAFDATGGLTGRDYQQAVRGLRRDAAALENQPFGYDFGDVTRQAEGALEGILARQSPDTIPALRAANETNRLVETLRDAVDRSRNGTRTGQTGVFSPSQLADAASRSARRFGNSHGTTQQPFYELTRAGQEVLPASVPDSGTAGRALIPALLLGGLGGGTTYAAQDAETPQAQRAGTSAATTSIIAALAAAPYSRTARDVVASFLMAERPAFLERAGQELLERDRIAGLLAAPYAVAAVPGQ